MASAQSYTAGHGYASKAYARSFAEHGKAILLPRSQAWVLERRIPDTDQCDATGLYPLFACPNWEGLQADIDEMGYDWITLSAVPDPMTSPEKAGLQVVFPDVVNPFKLHYLIDLKTPIAESANKHHRYESRRALKSVSADVVVEPWTALAEWSSFYKVLAERHDISGMQDFSDTAFDRQLRAPGMTMIAAYHENRMIGAHLWYAHGETVTSHLAAFSAEGYEFNCSYAIYWRATEIFAQMGYRWMNIGGGAGAEADATDGLTRFKRGWTKHTRTAYFCGRILNSERYAALTGETVAPEGAFFPRYRQPGFKPKT